MERPLLSVVAPAFNEADVLGRFHERLAKVLDGMPLRAEIVYVDDGSTDRTAAILEEFRTSDPRVAVVELSRQFGKERALTAGIDHARGDAVVVIDADLQDPPELIPDLVAPWRDDGYEVVYALRVQREGESWLRRGTASLFYRLIRRVSRVDIPRNTGDFRLLSRRAVDELKRLRERHRFMKGLFAWVGFAQKAVPYHREPRSAGRSKWNYWRLWNFALTGITSFTIAPLKIATYLGLLIAVLAFAYAVVIVYKTLVWGNPVAGYPSLMTVILFLGGVQLMTMGVMGEYLGRMFEEVKQRPLYIVKSYHPAADKAPDRAADDEA
ncbi:MAG: glycosyltransferase family 2 protein [Planctomycetota bacterium]|jgi:glycosyltransferase involved in cell wall biosynthesis